MSRIRRYGDFGINRQDSPYLAARTIYSRPTKRIACERGGANAGPNGVVRFEPPASLLGEEWEERLAAYRQHLRERHGLAMSRDGD